MRGHDLAQIDGVVACKRCGASGPDAINAMWCSQRLVGRRVLMPERWSLRHGYPHEGVVFSHCGPDAAYVTVMIRDGACVRSCARLESLEVLPGVTCAESQPTPSA